MKFIKTGIFGNYINTDSIETIESIKDDSTNEWIIIIFLKNDMNIKYMESYSSREEADKEIEKLIKKIS